MFVFELERANLGLVRSRLALASDLQDAAQRERLARSLGVPASAADAVAQTVQSQAKAGGQLGITAAHITFWVEPARPGWLERIVGFLLRRSPERFAGVFCLAPASRRAHALRCELEIGPVAGDSQVATTPQQSVVQPGALPQALGWQGGGPVRQARLAVLGFKGRP